MKILKKMHFCKVFLCMCFLSCTVSISSCSSGMDESLDDKREDERPVVGDELLPFIGYWVGNYKNGSNYCDFLLFDDGTCVSPSSVDSNVMTEGKWTFSENTKYLSNTATNKTFLLTFHDESEMIAIDISNNKTVFFTKKQEKDKNIPRLIMPGEWVSTDGAVLQIGVGSTFLGGSKVPELPTDTNSIKYKDKYILWELGDIGYTYIIRWKVEKWAGAPDNRWYENSMDSRYKGDVTIENPYSPSKCKVMLTGVLEGTYTKK